MNLDAALTQPSLSPLCQAKAVAAAMAQEGLELSGASNRRPYAEPLKIIGLKAFGTSWAGRTTTETASS